MPPRPVVRKLGAGRCRFGVLAECQSVVEPVISRRHGVDADEYLYPTANPVAMKDMAG